jgi:hypothetical protein
MDAQVLQKMITDYRKKIELYQAMIAEWEKELGIASSNGLTAQESQSEDGAKKKQQGGDILGMIREWQFFNKSQPEAARAVLEIVGHPLRTQQIMDAIEKGGVKVGGKTPKDKKQNFYTILHRSNELGRAAKDTWGLLTWPGVTKADAEETEEVNDKKAEKTKEATQK